MHVQLYSRDTARRSRGGRRGRADRADRSARSTIVYGDRHATTTTQAAGGRSSELPLATAIVLDVPDSAPVAVGVVAAGKLGATVLGTGAGSTIVYGEQRRS